MKLSNEEILERIDKLDYAYEIEDFISPLDLTPEQMELLADHENEDVRWKLTLNHNLPEKLMIMLSSDVYTNVRYDAFQKLKKLNIIKLEDFEKGYDSIRTSKNISRYWFKETFNYISNKFPELSKLAKMFKTIILKGKKDLK